MQAAATVRNNGLKPFAILAAIAFVVGFLGYLAAIGVNMNELQAELSSAPAPIAGPSIEHPAAVTGGGSDEWNVPKKI